MAPVGRNAHGGLTLLAALLSTQEARAAFVAGPVAPLVRPSFGSPRGCTASAVLGAAATSGGGEGHGDGTVPEAGKAGGRDLFDYFDPLRSPHDYPSGIDAAAAAPSPAADGSSSAAAGGDPDLPDYFDPRRSPHEYPSGVDFSAPARKKGDGGGGGDDDDDEDWNPLRIPSAAADSSVGPPAAEPVAPSRPAARTVASTAPAAVPPPAAAAPGGRQPDLFDVFDPRLSPHSYPGGIPDCSGGTADGRAGASYAAWSSPAPSDVQAEVKVGVLLIDHGSRRESSNDRLVELARVYEERSPDHYVVRAAHMEIVGPTVEEGIRELLDLGAGRIVCHPYFLSPGRHVTEDIPQLVSDAMESLSRPDVPIVTTEPVGSSFDVMIDAIGTVVDESLRELDGIEVGLRDDARELGGFFGDIQRMLEEEL